MSPILTQILITLLAAYTVSGVRCVLNNVSNETRVYCNNRRLTRLPSTWPTSHVTWLDVSTNNLTSGGGLEDPHLAGLRHLDLRGNLLQGVPSENLAHVEGLEWLDLSDNPLGAVAAEAFRGLPHLTWLGLGNTELKELQGQALSHLPGLLALDLSRNRFQAVPVSALRQVKTLQSLELSYNDLREIADGSFSNLTNLSSLYISNNGLSRLSSEIFSGLSQLKVLDIRANNLLLTHDSFPAGVFRHLPALESLYMENNANTGTGIYPLNVFSPLTALKVLSIDTFSETYFGEAFTSLKSLTHLLLGSGCQMDGIRNSTLAAFKNSSLQHITMNCHIGHIEICAFCDLPNLQTLRLTSNSHLTLDTALRAMYGLQNQSLSLIDLSHTRFHTEPASINRENSKYLANVCVESLSLRDCLIGSISTSSFNYFRGPLSACLKHLDISRNTLNNWIIFRLYNRIMIRLRKLETFNLHNQMIRTVMDDLCFLQAELCGAKTPNTSMSSLTMFMTISPSLQRLDASGFVPRVPTAASVVHCHNAGNLTGMDVSYIGLGRCDFEIRGLENLQDINLRGNYCKLMSEAFFRNLGALRRLVLANLNLDPAVLLARGKLFFSNLRLLEEVDLSLNGLSSLQPDLFTAQPRLQKLNLARNRFQEVPVDITHHSNLSELDLSFNSMTSLTPHERRAFDSHASTRPGFTLRLRGNPFSCPCSSLAFVRWLATTAVRLDGDNNNEGHDDDYDDNGRVYPCLAQDGSMTDTGVVIADWDFHWRRCVGPQALLVALVLLSLQLLALLVTFVLTRNWTHLVYAVRALRNYTLPRRQDFRKDAYVGYADADVDLALEADLCLERLRSVRLLLRYKEELPGSIRAENVVEHIDESWKVLVLVTQAMTQDEWSIFTLQLAQRSISDRLPDRVIVVFRDDPVGMPHMTSLERLLRMVPERNVFHIPRHSSPRHPGWNQIAEIIRTDRTFP